MWIWRWNQQFVTVCDEQLYWTTLYSDEDETCKIESRTRDTLLDIFLKRAVTSEPGMSELFSWGQVNKPSFVKIILLFPGEIFNPSVKRMDDHGDTFSCSDNIFANNSHVFGVVNQVKLHNDTMHWVTTPEHNYSCFKSLQNLLLMLLLNMLRMSTKFM